MGSRKFRLHINSPRSHHHTIIIILLTVSNENLVLHHDNTSSYLVYDFVLLITCLLESEKEINGEISFNCQFSLVKLKGLT